MTKHDTIFHRSGWRAAIGVGCVQPAEWMIAMIAARSADESLGHAATIFDTSGLDVTEFCESICELRVASA